MKPKNPELYDIWQEEEPPIPELPFRMQLLNYVAQYPCQEAAEKHREAIQKERAAQERKAVTKKK